jgi:50S ribosomal protein L16 3-hydroxylase
MNYNRPMKTENLLGDMSPTQFMRDYWHKKPLLIRQAIPGFTPLLPRSALFKLAADDAVESRLVSHFDSQWQIQSGPFDTLPPPDAKQWTLLVQGVNLHDDAVDALLRRFRFIPDARLDDLMVSFASDGGGVGPHFDSYDVFLLQAHGQRRWRIGQQKDLTLDEAMPLKILRHFEPEQEFILEPGDMLYLPPHYAHDGVAIGECMTYSIGFRAPSYQELGEAFLQFMADSIDLPGMYADPDLMPCKNPAEISAAMVAKIAEQLNKVRFTEEDVTVFLGENLSEPEHNVFFTPPAQPLTPARFALAAAKRGVILSRKSLMLYHGSTVFINGESFEIGRADKTTIKALANNRKLDGAALGTASDDVAEALYTWYQDGWLLLAAS